MKPEERERDPERELDVELAPGPKMELEPEWEPDRESEPGHRDSGLVEQAQQRHRSRWVLPPPARCRT